MKKKWFAAWLTGMMLLLTVGCGSTSKMENAVDETSAAMMEMGVSETYDEVAEEVKEIEAAAGTENGLDTLAENGRKLIRTMNLSMETTEFEQVLNGLEQRTNELGGYIEESSIRGKSYYHDNSRYASYWIRIPSQKLDEFVVRVAIQNFKKNAVISTVFGFQTTDFLACNFIIEP